MKFTLSGYFHLLSLGLVVGVFYAVFTSETELPYVSEVKKFSQGVANSAKELVIASNADKEDAAKQENDKGDSVARKEGDSKEGKSDGAKVDELSKSEDAEKSESEPGVKSESSEDADTDAEADEDAMANEEGVEEDSDNESEPDKEEEPAFKIVLPTDNREIFEDPTKFYMHTNRYIDGVNTKPWTGGKYGFVRNKLSTRVGTVFTRLHEGIDIRPLKRDKNRIPLDDVYTIADGVVAYVNSSSSRSNYGRYIVVKHVWPDGDFYSLYAHLASTAVKSGQKVMAGDTLGRLGYSGDGIDRERAHVHVELAFLLSEKFNTRYSPGNGHRNFNGLNLTGLDIGRFLQEHQKNPHITMKEFLDAEEPYYKVQTSTSRKPGILSRHPWLGTDMEKSDTAKSWEITFARSGVPLSIAPCEASHRYPIISWVKTVNTNHSYMTAGRLLGSGSKAKLSSRGHRYIKLISEAF